MATGLLPHPPQVLFILQLLLHSLNAQTAGAGLGQSQEPGTQSGPLV